MYQRKVDVDMLNAVKSVLADVSSVSPSSEQRVFRLREKREKRISRNVTYSILSAEVSVLL